MSRRCIIPVLLLCGCFSGYEAKDANTPRVHRGTFVNTLVLTGELDAQRGAIITVPRLPMWQTSLKWIATDGDVVREGDRVAELDNGPFARIWSPSASWPPRPSSSCSRAKRNRRRIST